MKIRKYMCGSCDRPLEARGTGLKTWTCPQHPRRFISVPRDLSGGKEADKMSRNSTVTVSRHTRVQRRNVENQ